MRRTGDFSRVHPWPHSGQDVPDDLDARLVVLRVDHPYGKEPNSPAEKAARAILESRGSAPRLYRNALVFLAVDKVRFQDLDESVRRYLAWESILAEQEQLDLSRHQVKQAETQKASADRTVTVRLPEAYQWLLVPGQATPQSPVEWQAIRLSGQDDLAARASKKLRGEEGLLTVFGATRLRMELDKVPLWRGDHVSIRQLIEDFARYPYLSRLKNPEVLLEAIREGVMSLAWEQEGFAYAESHDEAAGRYRGLRVNRQLTLPDADAPGLLVKPNGARKQLEAEALKPAVAGLSYTPAPGGETSVPPPEPGATGTVGVPPPGPQPPKRFHGTVVLDAERVGRDAGRIAEEVISHLAGLVGSNVKVTLEIEAEIPAGAPDKVVRTVTENSRTLKFSSFGFEVE